MALVVCPQSGAMTPAKAVQTAVLRHASECRYVCRQAKRLVWPAARMWHTLTGWPQADVERPAAPALFQATLSACFQAAGGALVTSVACLYGLLGGHTSPRSVRATGAALGEVLAAPLNAGVDLIGLGGATVLALAALALDILGATVGTLVGMLWAPRIAFDAAAGMPA